MTIKDLKDILNKLDENQPIKIKELIRNPHYLGYYSKIYNIDEIFEERNCMCFKISKSIEELSNVYRLPEILDKEETTI